MTTGRMNALRAFISTGWLSMQAFQPNAANASQVLSQISQNGATKHSKSRSNSSKSKSKKIEEKRAPIQKETKSVQIPERKPLGNITNQTITTCHYKEAKNTYTRQQKVKLHFFQASLHVRSMLQPHYENEEISEGEFKRV
jgi:cytoskeletal protein RodZ